MSKWRISCAEIMHPALRMNQVGSVRSPISARCVVFELLYPPTTISRSSVSSKSWKSASCRSCVAPQIVSKKRKFAVAVPRADRRSNSRLDFLGLAPQHCRLVRHADALKMDVGIKAGRMRTLKMPEKGGLVSAVADIIANTIRLIEIEINEIVPLAFGPEST